MMPSAVNDINISSNLQKRKTATTLHTVSRSLLSSDIVNVLNFQSPQRRHLPLKLLLGSFFYPLSHLFCMLFASFPFFQPLKWKETDPDKKIVNKINTMMLFISCVINTNWHTSFFRQWRIARSMSLHVPKNFMTLCWWRHEKWLCSLVRHHVVTK